MRCGWCGCALAVRAHRCPRRANQPNPVEWHSKKRERERGLKISHRPIYPSMTIAAAAAAAAAAVDILLLLLVFVGPCAHRSPVGIGEEKPSRHFIAPSPLLSSPRPRKRKELMQVAPKSPFPPRRRHYPSAQLSELTSSFLFFSFPHFLSKVTLLLCRLPLRYKGSGGVGQTLRDSFFPSSCESIPSNLLAQKTFTVHSAGGKTGAAGHVGGGERRRRGKKRSYFTFLRHSSPSTYGGGSVAVAASVGERH